MIRVLLAILVVVAVWYFMAKLRAQPEHRRRYWYQVLLAMGIGILVLLAATGRLHWLYALVAAAIPLLRRGMMLLGYLPMVRQFKNHFASREGEEDRAQAAAKPEDMDVTQAYQVLDLEPGATREAIVEAHRRLIQRLHPDRGGSAHLAAQINRAKELLLRSV